MNNPTYEPIDENSNHRPATRADIEEVLRAIEILSEQIKQIRSNK